MRLSTKQPLKKLNSAFLLYFVFSASLHFTIVKIDCSFGVCLDFFYSCDNTKLDFFEDSELVHCANLFFFLDLHLQSGGGGGGGGVSVQH